MGSVQPPQRRYKADSVAVIGAGPSGLAAAKYLLAEKAFSTIVVYEQRSQVGGLWNHTPCDAQASQALPVPQTSPHFKSNGSNSLRFMSPVYDRLETNIPRGLMGFSDLNWPQDSRLFPGHETVLKYIDDYAADVKYLIRFDTEVLEVVRGSEKWSIKTRTINGEEGEQSFDAVIVANGHFNVPYIPNVPNIQAWHEKYPASITHSKFYRRPEDFKDKKVIVIGNSASGVDIGAQIRQYCRKPLIQSLRSESQFLPEPNADQVEKPPISRYEPETRTVVFDDGSRESNVDSIVYCTGYLYSFPFLESLKPALISTGERVHNLYKHIFYQTDPTLSFLVLNQKVIPFPVAEVQSAVIARVLSGSLSLPDESTMRQWEHDLVQDCPREKDLHVLKFPKDADYINELHDWALTADRSADAGKQPPSWDEEAYWTREKFPDIKKTFQALGEERYDKRTLQDIGFDFAAEASA